MRRVTSLLLLFVCWSTLSLSHFVRPSSSSDVADRGSNSTATHSPEDCVNITGSETNTTLKLQVLVMLPLDPLNDTKTREKIKDDDHDHDLIQKWDRGLEMLPGAQLAVEAINKEPHLLPGYELEIIKISVDPCLPLEVLTNINAFVPFANGSLENNTIGILGLFCDRLVHTLSPLAGRDEYGLFQLSGTTSPLIREHLERYTNTHLNFISPSRTAYYETLFLLMRELRWNRTLVLYEDVFNLTHVRNSTKQALNITFREHYHNISAMIHEIRITEKNIVYVAIGPRQTANLLCTAYKDGLKWPDYVWIIQDHSVDDLLMYTHKECTTEELMEALQNTILLRFQKEQQNRSKELDTGNTYETYLQQYMNVLNESGQGLLYNEFANVMHDSVWAFALALNRSLGTIARDNMTVIDFIKQFGKRELTKTMEDHLPSLSFEGASGRIQFNNDYDIQVMVFMNNSTIKFGCYNHLSGNISLKMPIPFNIPPDKLLSQYNMIPLPVFILLVIVVILCLIFTTTMFILFIKYRRYSEIKAASPYLSLFMFVGTYLILISTLVQAIMTGIVSPTNNAASAVLCGSVITGNIIGINLIFSTLLLRMLRVYRIFSYFGRTGKIWSDKVLVVIVLLIVGSDLVLLIIWFCVDPYTVKEDTHYKHLETPPHYEITQYCTSDGKIEAWFSLIFGKVGILFAIVLFLAIKTRKIQRENFKDTKKVNIYIFITVLIIATLIPVWFLLKGMGNVIGIGIVIYVAFGATGLLNQLMLFTPKVFPPVLRSLGCNIYPSPRSKLQKATIRRKDTSNSRGFTLSHTNQVVRSLTSSPSTIPHSSGRSCSPSTNAHIKVFTFGTTSNAV